ncbi:MAG: HEAT repeat domain-containing protein [Proteobacteria bacterium]|nr:HEAT repeat domain-containing protein [Pseudomonadota bacterium]
MGALTGPVSTVISGRSAIADTRIDELSKMLSSSSDKTRLSAVAVLARLDDKSALKPLVTALHDPNPQVRAIAATALGSLGHKAALPALRTAATDDADAKVRTAAATAAKLVARANNLPAEPAPAPAVVPAIEARSAGRPGFGHQPRAVQNRPDLYVAINSASDDAPGKHDKAARKQHGELLKQTLASALTKNPTVTMTAAEGTRWGLDLRHVDLSVVKLEVGGTDAMIEIDAQLRLAISDDKGRMMSFLSGGAKVQVRRATYNAAYLPNLRKEAIENAMVGMVEKLIAQLRRPNA